MDEDAVALEPGTYPLLDVFEEPVDPSHPLLQMEHSHGTPHIGASTVEAQGRAGMDIVTNVMDVLQNRLHFTSTVHNLPLSLSTTGSE